MAIDLRDMETEELAEAVAVQYVGLTRDISDATNRGKLKLATLRTEEPGFIAAQTEADPTRGVLAARPGRRFKVQVSDNVSKGMHVLIDVSAADGRFDGATSVGTGNWSWGRYLQSAVAGEEPEIDFRAQKY